MSSYLLDGSSFRRLGQRWRVGYVTAWRRVQRSLATKLPIGEIIAVSSPANVNIIILDAKRFSLRHKAWTLYLALDGMSGQPLVWVLLPRTEKRYGYDLLLKHLKAKYQRIQAVVSDWHVGILASVTDYLPQAVHQRCAFHVLQEVSRKLGGRRWHTTIYGQQDWTMFRRVALGFPTEREARVYLNRTIREYPQYVAAFGILKDSLSDIYQFSRCPELNVPHTSNKIENFMGCLEQRIKVMRGIKTPQTLAGYINRLILIRNKKPTNK